ncbi:MAG TPA: DNA-processing protein DprA [Patescibacteria group bacterium]
MKELNFSQTNYPEALKTIDNAPQVLYINGEIKPQDKKAVAIVGTRQMSERGKRLALDFSYNIARSGITIVSGLARGIDTIAHRGALKGGGRTIAVLGSGLDVIYPPENRSLYTQIMKNGAVVSEYPSKVGPYQVHFLQRNRIITGLSLAVLVIEGDLRSGTRSTAGWAADQGKEVFAVPGSPITDFLIENGAAVGKSPEIIINYVNSIL